MSTRKPEKHDPPKADVKPEAKPEVVAAPVPAKASAVSIKVRDAADHVTALRVQAEGGNPPTVEQLDVLKAMVEAIGS